MSITYICEPILGKLKLFGEIGELDYGIAENVERSALIGQFYNTIMPEYTETCGTRVSSDLFRSGKKRIGKLKSVL